MAESTVCPTRLEGNNRRTHTGTCLSEVWAERTRAGGSVVGLSSILYDGEYLYSSTAHTCLSGPLRHAVSGACHCGRCGLSRYRRSGPFEPIGGVLVPDHQGWRIAGRTSAGMTAVRCGHERRARAPFARVATGSNRDHPWPGIVRRAVSPLPLHPKDCSGIEFVPSRKDPGALVALLGRLGVAQLIVDLALQFVEPVILAVQADSL